MIDSSIRLFSTKMMMMKMGFSQPPYRRIFNYLSVINRLLMTVKLKSSRGGLLPRKWQLNGNLVANGALTELSHTETAYQENVLVAARKLAKSFPLKNEAELELWWTSHHPVPSITTHCSLRSPRNEYLMAVVPANKLKALAKACCILYGANLEGAGPHLRVSM